MSYYVNVIIDGNDGDYVAKMEKISESDIITIRKFVDIINSEKFNKIDKLSTKEIEIIKKLIPYVEELWDFSFEEKIKLLVEITLFDVNEVEKLL